MDREPSPDPPPDPAADNPPALPPPPDYDPGSPEPGGTTYVGKGAELPSRFGRDIDPDEADLGL